MAQSQSIPEARTRIGRAIRGVDEGRAVPRGAPAAGQLAARRDPGWPGRAREHPRDHPGRHRGGRLDDRAARDRHRGRDHRVDLDGRRWIHLHAVRARLLPRRAGARTARGRDGPRAGARRGARDLRGERLLGRAARPGRRDDHGEPRALGRHDDERGAAPAAGRDAGHLPLGHRDHDRDADRPPDPAGAVLRARPHVPRWWSRSC